MLLKNRLILAHKPNSLPMNCSLFVAKKYFFTSTKKKLIHRISLVACFSVALSTMALILVLSVFNGLEGLLKSLFHAFDPDIKIELKQGKYFKLTPELQQQISNVPGIHKVVEVIEDNALLCYQEHHLVARLKGVSDNFTDKNPLEAFITQGKFSLKKDRQNFALLGMGIQYMLSINVKNALEGLQIYYPKPIKKGINLLQPFYDSKLIKPGAVFTIEKHFDDNYIIVPLDFAAELMGLTDERTALEVQVSPKVSLKKVKNLLKNCLPTHFKIRDQEEQQATLMRAIRIERLFVLLTFAFILCIASLNSFFIVSMLVLDKRKDVAVLYALGATQRMIQSIFLLEGLLIALSGTVLGMAIAWLLTWLQERFGIVSLDMQTSIISAYPIERHLSDFVYTTLAVIIITLIATYRPAQIATKTSIKAYL